MWVPRICALRRRKDAICGMLPEFVIEPENEAAAGSRPCVRQRTQEQVVCLVAAATKLGWGNPPNARGPDFIDRAD